MDEWRHRSTALEVDEGDRRKPRDVDVASDDGILQQFVGARFEEWNVELRNLSEDDREVSESCA
jgi:hypothetical protein